MSCINEVRENESVTHIHEFLYINQSINIYLYRPLQHTRWTKVLSTEKINK